MVARMSDEPASAPRAQPLTVDGVRYHVDYAWADQGRLEDTHRFSFGLLF